MSGLAVRLEAVDLSGNGLRSCELVDGLASVEAGAEQTAMASRLAIEEMRPQVEEGKAWASF